MAFSSEVGAPSIPAIVDPLSSTHDHERAQHARQGRIRLAAVLFLVLVVVFNDEVLMRALFMALLVPLMRDFQKRLNNAAVCRYTDELLGTAERRSAKHR